MSTISPPDTIGGGTKKVLYTLNTIRQIGIRRWAKALKSHNTCKACGLGMGGQRGGMVNELNEFPAVCNKSIQAQSTDIQPPVPSELFIKHPVKDFKELSGKEIEHLGRLGAPIYKEEGSDYYKEISWDLAFETIADAMRGTDPDRSFFYSSGRSSNEAGFVLQMLARLYGTNNVNNCSYYCHQATGVALGNTIGTGTATVELKDLAECDLIFLIGANPASNHPRLIHKLKDLRERGGRIVVINPAKEPGLVRFAVPKSAKSLLFGGTVIASEYLQPRIGSDILLFKGIAKAVFESGHENVEFIRQYTAESDAFFQDVASTSWQQITQDTGVPKAEIEKVALLYSQSGNTVFAWGMGMTHHVHGVENVEYISNLALLRGMIGRPGAGLLPLRGHSNVQGIGTIGVKPVLAQQVIQSIEQHFNVSLPETKGMDTISCLEAASAGKVDFALMMGGNLYGASPDHHWAANALNNISLKVYLTTTLNHGHMHGIESGNSLVLPVTARDEEWEATTQESMFNYVRLSDGGIERLAGAKPETHVLSEIAELVLVDTGLDFSVFRKHKNIRDAIAACVPGMEKLAAIDATKQEFHIGGRLLHEPVFRTGDGRARFVTHRFKGDTTDPEFPFKMMTVRSEGQFNTIVYEEEDTYRATFDRWCVLMSPADMMALNLKDEDRVTLYSAQGEMHALKVYPFDLPEKNLMTYFPEANVLIGRKHDPRSQTPAFKSVDVALEVIRG